jgi:hypothetical protein
MLTPQQKEALLKAKAEGLTKEQAFSRAFATNSATATPGVGSDIFQDVSSTFSGLGEDLYQRGGNILDSFAASRAGTQNPIQTGMQVAGETIGGAGDIAGRTLFGGLSLFTSQDTEDKVVEGVTSAVSSTGLPQKYEALSEERKRDVRGGLGVLEGLTAALPTKLSSLFKGAKAPDIPNPQVQVDDVFKRAEEGLKRQAEDVNLDPKAKEEAARAALTFQERYIGLEPDVKARLQEMGPVKLQEYLDAVHLRNIDDTAPTPYELGSQNVNTAVETLQKNLSATGSGIGQIRQKLATVRTPVTSVERIESVFRKELDSLNLQIKNGQVVLKPGSIGKTDATSDLKVIQSLYDDLLTFKQNPSLKNAIDLRMAFDGKIKFGKSARDVSNSVDPLSRSVRSAIAQESARVVGKTNAQDLQRYSDFMEAYGDLRSYTDRAAGGEYLLRLVLSGRGGESRKLIQTIKEYTGIDLMNDATAMKVATDVLGNQNTQNLFRQEITKAGFDVVSGDVKGLLETGARKLMDIGIDPEEILKKIAAGTAGVFLLTYIGEDGEFLPPGLAIIGAMAVPNRVKILNDTIKALDEKRGVLMKSGLPENHPSIKANEKARANAVKLRDQVKDETTGE